MFTYSAGSTSLEDCKAKCPPGTYSDTGLEPCARCPVNFYQKEEGKTNCTECPLKQRTFKPGARFAEACVDADINAIECKNGGLKVNGHHEFVCVCPSGFTGKQCEVNINECDSSPCFNGGTCIDRAQGYKCECRKGYFGLNCELEHSECEPGSCPEAAMCHDLPGRNSSVKCLCREGYRGKNCDVTMNPCKCVDLDRVNPFFSWLNYGQEQVLVKVLYSHHNFV